MEAFISLADVPTARLAGGAVTIGNFDGVHLGHRRLIARAGELARPVVAVTFDPPPMAVLSPPQSPPIMTPLSLKLELLDAAGADFVVVLPTTRELLGLEPETFVRTVLAERLSPSAVVEGRNFGFGRGRAGDVDTLRQLGRQYGFRVEVVDPVARQLPGHQAPATISSTLIRRLVGGGSVEAAAVCLGRPYRLLGRPVPGAARGRRIGFPTVNLDTHGQLLPAEGVYAGFARCAQHEGPSAVSIGPAPTFGVSEATVEAHLLDFSGELKVDSFAVDVLARLRGIVRFESVEALVEQVRRDIRQVREAVAGAALPSRESSD